ncbi:hypothetical protein TYRP_006986 [Tyrophagus putrescentiae]|nr:hypothetical protein TYRP_006986 [Tyrophagus putrescentiae]
MVCGGGGAGAGSSRGEEEDEMLLEKWEKYLTELLDLDWIEVGSSHDFLMGAGETTETEMKCKICPTVRCPQPALEAMMVISDLGRDRRRKERLRLITG